MSAQEQGMDTQNTSHEEAAAAPVLHIAPGPHLSDPALTTRRMMFDVVLALSPLLIVAVAVFRWAALIPLATSVISCLAAEALFTAMRGRRSTLPDLSALVTGLILGLSLPALAPWYAGVIGGFVAIGLGKAVFGGLGGNLFNPAMVGRAFVMIAFPAALGAAAYIAQPETFAASIDALTQATPLTAWAQDGQAPRLWNLLLGTVNGSIGETSAIACLLGGLYLCLRRSASWEIPAGAILAVTLITLLMRLAPSAEQFVVLEHLAAGAFLFGAFFIATDPVSSPITPRGKLIFGAGYGALVMLMRGLSGYPEGVMFSVLIMNALTPLINRATRRVPVGGPVKVA